MNKLKISMKNLSTLTATFVLISMCGCSSNKEKDSVEESNIKTTTGNYMEYNYDNYLDSMSPFTEESGYEIKTTTTKEEIQLTTTSTYTTIPIATTPTETTTTSVIIEASNDATLSEDKLINNYFEKAKEEIKTLLDSKEYETAKTKAKEFVKTGVDFIFYNKSINGITFNDITEECKKVTYESLNTIDSWIMEIYPDYKEELSDKYAIVSEFISEKYYYAKEEIKEYITEENYNALIDIKDRIGNSIQDGYETAKEKTKDWYNTNFN